MNARLKFRDHIKLIRNIRTTGMVSPSSRRLIDRMLAPIDFETATCIVELGPGNGCITHRLLKMMREDAILICLEVNNDFVAQLNAINDPRLKVYNACASSVPAILQEMGLSEVDHVLSSLPLAIMDKKVINAVLESARENLRPGGHFLQYQYSLKNLDDIRPVFNNAKVRFTVRNMPPAFIYECTK